MHFIFEIFHSICLVVSIFIFFYVMLQMNNPKKNNLIGLESLKLLTVVGFVINLYGLPLYVPYFFTYLEYIFYEPSIIIPLLVSMLFLVLHIVHWVKICKKKKAIRMYVEKMNGAAVNNSQSTGVNNSETQNTVHTENSNSEEYSQAEQTAPVPPIGTPIPNYTKSISQNNAKGEKSTTDLAALLTSIFTIPLEALIYFTNLETDTEWVSLWGSEKFEREVTYLPDETKTLMILLMLVSLGVSYFLIFRKGKNYSNKATWVKIINAINIIAGIVIIMLQ